MGMTLEQMNQLKPGDRVFIEGVVKGQGVSNPYNTVVIVERGLSRSGNFQEPMYIGIHHDYLVKVPTFDD